MLLFKTSAATLENVVSNQKHALKDEPKNWERGEYMLISKNKLDCKKGEKQIQYLMKLESVERLNDEEIKKYWPDAKNNWRFLVNCTNTVKLSRPFDLIDLLGAKSSEYGPALKPKKIKSEDEKIIMKYLKETDALN